MILRQFTTPFRVAALVFPALLTCLAAPVAAIAQGGLDQAVPVTSYLNGVLPSRRPGSSAGDWTLVNAFPSLGFTEPTQMLAVPGGTRLLVAEKIGRLVVFENDPSVTTKTTILDLAARVNSQEDSGLLGVAFHPEFGEEGSPNRDFLYLFYRYSPAPSLKHPGYLRLSRFAWTGATGLIDPSSEFILIQQYDRNNWHNGGGLCFGNDGFLYLTLGDEGGLYDEYGSGQKIDGGFFSGVLRLDVDEAADRSHPIRRQPLDPAPPPPGWPSSFSQGYFVPDDNPWQSAGGAQLEEFWSIGLRSPYRMTLDPVTDELWLGDVGQSHREEINLVTRGANYQWPYLEGDRPALAAKPVNLIGNETPPLLPYPRMQGGCVIGGYVYRGTSHLDLVGHYVYGDWIFGSIRSLIRDPEGTPVVKELVTLPRHGPGPRNGLSGFGIDAEGEIHVLSSAGNNQSGGIIYRLARSQGVEEEPPALLSETETFEDLDTLAPSPALLPYAPIQELWSDGAEKQRWIAIPNDGTPDSTAERILYSDREEWAFPIGTVLVKHFGFGARKVETRFLVRGSDGVWFGFTYRWREDQSDAELLPDETLVETIEIAPGQQTRWYFPSRTECFTCHTAAAGRVLGVQTRHLNGNFTYPATGRTANQLVTLNRLGFLSPALNEFSLPELLTSVALDDTSATFERRARSYLDVNCSHCHRAGGTAPTAFDLRLSFAPFFQNLIGVTATNPLGIPGAKILTPGDETLSILHHRLNSVDESAMPPLAKSLVDHDAVAVITAWIRSLDPETTPGGPVTGPGPQDHRPPFFTALPGSGAILYGPQQVQLAFSEPVTGLDLDDFDTGNTDLSLLGGSGAERFLTLTPRSPGPLTLSLPSDRLTDLNGNANGASPSLDYEYREPLDLAGLRYDYYEVRLGRIPDFSSLTPVRSGITDTINLSPRLRDEDFALRFYGDLLLDQEGEYEFTLESDEGARLWIDGVLLIDLDGLHEATAAGASVTLREGRHRIDVAYFERGGNETLRVGMAGPGIAAESIPAARLKHRADAGPAGGGDPAIRAYFYPDPTADHPPSRSTGLQPDQWIGLTRRGRLGDDLYNLSGIGQTLRIRLGREGDRTFFVTLENDRLVPDDALMRASRPGRSHRAEFRLGRRNVTAALFSGRLRPGPLAPRGTHLVEASVRSNEIVRRGGGRTRIDITATSSHPGISGDRVSATLPAPRQGRR